LRDGQTEVRASVNIVEPVLDGGRLLMISAPLEVDLGNKGGPYASMPEGLKFTSAAIDYQALLKRIGDWVIMPKTLQFLAEGRYEQDEAGNIHFDGEPIPNGIRLEKEEEKDDII